MAAAKVAQGHCSAQLSLPLDAAPAIVRDHGLMAAHPRPSVGRRKPNGTFGQWRTSPEQAWMEPYLQIENAGSSFATITLDCDDPRKAGLAVAELPPPNWIVSNVANDHSHMTWALASPVHRHPEGRIAPLRNYSRISAYYHHATGADLGYAHTLTRNPVIDNGTATAWGSTEPYSLDELASVIPFGWRAPRTSETVIGRNVTLFSDCMAWAGRPENATTAVLTAATIRNQKFDTPLSAAEVSATAKSVERYRAGWSAHGWHTPKWIARQARRGRLGGLKSAGKPKRGSKNASASPDVTNEATKPWEAEGISRRTWYSRRAKAEAEIVQFALFEPDNQTLLVTIAELESSVNPMAETLARLGRALVERAA